MRRILFVCTGNIYRSVLAEYALRQYIEEQGIKGYSISSAGTSARKQKMHDTVLHELNRRGIEPVNHYQRRLTKEIIGENDVIIAMAKDHSDFIRKKFGNSNVLLFNELGCDKNTSVWDIDKVKDYETNNIGVRKAIIRTANHIFSSIPALFQSVLDRYYVFEDISLRRRNHRNGFPLVTLYESENVISFMSLDIPREIGTHILVLPKKRYVHYHHIPRNVRREISDAINKIGLALQGSYEGYNVLLNDGVAAGQYVYHCHFHIIPRLHNDSIRIEVWERKDAVEEEFVAASMELKKKIERIK
jgi:protein-tyrosine-phosphatase/diadenosine tetraphosphate (Ap4A) HIT family hydrolase